MIGPLMCCSFTSDFDDATAPTVTATPGRAADHNGWYNSPVAVSFAGQDATSGGVSCDPTRLYAGPDNPAVGGLLPAAWGEVAGQCVRYVGRLMITRSHCHALKRFAARRLSCGSEMKSVARTSAPPACSASNSPWIGRP